VACGHCPAAAWSSASGRPPRWCGRTREETGLDVRVAELLDVDAEQLEFERDGQRVAGHPIRILYRVEVVGGTLGVSEVDGSTAEAAWWRRDAIEEAALTPFTAAALRTGRLS
jgi:ADP-ribose pyrophosphatase YjhB (NUDIX family)